MESALAAFLELLAAADQPCFVWGPAELRAAFQWGDTLQRVVDRADAVEVVRARLQALQPQLPPGLRAVLPALAQRPLQLLLERLLVRPLAAQHAAGLAGRPAGSSWTEAVLSAYMAAVVLRRPPGLQQAAAERHLLAALASQQQSAAVHGLLHEAAQQAASAAAADLQWCGNGNTNQVLATEERRGLLREALQLLSSPECLQSAAAAQLLAHRAEQGRGNRADADAAAAPMQPGEQPPLEQQAVDGTGLLGSLLHSPPTRLELELLCLLALLPCWEAVLQQLAGLEVGGRSSSGCSNGAASGGAAMGGAAAVHQAVQLLCTACMEQPDAMLAQHPALLAEVCRCSFRFTCCYAALLAGNQQRANEDTRAAAEEARWRVAHAAKHPDHVTSYLLAKGCTV